MTPQQRTILRNYALATLGAGAVAVSLYFGGFNPVTQRPDPITVGGETIEFTWTDDNTNEDLLIYTDKQTYEDGFSHAVVYAAVTNQSGVDQDVSLMGSFVNQRRYIKDVSVLTEATFVSTTTEKGNCIDMTGKQVQNQIDSGANVDDYFVTETTATGTTPRMFEVCTKVVNSTYATSTEWVTLPQTKRDIYEIAIEEGYLDKLNAIRKSVEGYVAENKTLSFPIKAGQTMYYKLDIEYPSNDAGNFFLEAVGSEGAYGHLDPWFNASWSYRVSVTVDDAKVPGTVSSFPVFVDLSDLPADFHTNVKTDGCDIRVVESDETTETPFELVDYDATGDTGELHFLADSLTGSGGGDTVFYIYYGNSGASCYSASDTYGSDNVWSAYAGVWHFDDGSGTRYDSTANANDLTDQNSPSTVAGSMGYAMDLENTSSQWTKVDYANQTNLEYSGADFEVSMRVKTESAPADWDQLYSHWGSNRGSQAIIGGTKITFYVPKITIHTNWQGTITTFAANTWYNFRLQFDGSAQQVRVLRDGVDVTGWVSATYSGPFPTAPYAPSATFSWGSSNTGGSYFDGLFDEGRIRYSWVSTDWDTTEYNNQSDTSTFYSVGTQEENATARRIIRSTMTQ